MAGGNILENLAAVHGRFIRCPTRCEPALGPLLSAPLLPSKQSSGRQSPLVLHLVNQGDQLRNPAQRALLIPK